MRSCVVSINPCGAASKHRRDPDLRNGLALEQQRSGLVVPTLHREPECLDRDHPRCVGPLPTAGQPDRSVDACPVAQVADEDCMVVPARRVVRLELQRPLVVLLGARNSSQFASCACAWASYASSRTACATRSDVGAVAYPAGERFAAGTIAATLVAGRRRGAEGAGIRAAATGAGTGFAHAAGYRSRRAGLRAAQTDITRTGPRRSPSPALRDRRAPPLRLSDRPRTRAPARRRRGRR